MVSSAKDLVQGWSQPWVFIAAVSAAAVALGGGWQVFLLAPAHGGAAFVLLYVLFVGLFGLPVLMAELMLGRRGRGSPLTAMRALALEGRFSPAWKFVGGLAMLSGFLMLSYVSLSSVWSLAYGLRLLTGEFTGASPEQLVQAFESFLAKPWLLLGLLALFLGVTVAVLSRGLAAIETLVRVLAPLLLVAVLALLVFSVNQGDAQRSAAVLLNVNLAQLGGDSVVLALRLAFYSLALGLALLMMSGAHLPKKTSIGVSASAIVVLSILVSLTLSFVLAAFVSQAESVEQRGLTLLFVHFPAALVHLPEGGLIGALFFGVMALTGWLAALALLEPVRVWFLEKGWLNRVKVALILGGLAWLLALPWVLAFDEWLLLSLVRFLQAVTALLLVIFAGWIMKRTVVEKELHLASYAVYAGWTVVLRLLCPLAIVLLCWDLLKVN